MDSSLPRLLLSAYFSGNRQCHHPKCGIFFISCAGFRFCINHHDDRGMVMLSQRTVETGVGLFLLAALAALVLLAFKVSGLTSFFHQEGYTITALFDEVGQLKVRSTVKIG